MVRKTPVPQHPAANDNNDNNVKNDYCYFQYIRNYCEINNILKWCRETIVTNENVSGLRVDWKFYMPRNQGSSPAAAGQRAQRAETGTAQASFGAERQSRVVQAPLEPETHYQPYSAIPNHIKDLLAQSYAPQGPYVDPGAFLYQVNAPIVAPSAAPSKVDQSAGSQSQLEREYFNTAVTYRGHQGHQPARQQPSPQVGRVPSRLGGIKYKDDDRPSERTAQPLPYGAVIAAQPQAKSQYQPYKQVPQPQYQPYKQISQPQYQPYKQISQPQYRQYEKEASVAQPQYRQYEKPTTVAQPQYRQFKKQVSQAESQQQAFDKQAAQPRLQYKQYKASSDAPSQPEVSGHMPMAIQQLLLYQAQLPYNVIANHILYRPKEPFVPKPLPESAKTGRQYPSKVYFVKSDGEIYEGPDNVNESAAAKRY